jgi:hypothetical protein
MSAQSGSSERRSAIMTLPGDQNAAGARGPAPLAKEIKRAGMFYREIFRKSGVAIYCTKGVGPRIEYEVFKVQILPAQEINDSFYPAREAFPKASEWGELGWTFTNNSHRDPSSAAFVKARHIASSSSLEALEGMSAAAKGRQ